jgi:predicted short-subunit dehydrogenase-like oxidoreductase (DUF2520 family)
MVKRKKLNVAIVGGGKVGSVVGRLLTDRGHRLTAVISRTLRSARGAGRFAGCRTVSTDPGAIATETDIIFIATPHDAIAGVVGNLTDLDHLRFKRLAVCHASGIYDASVLDPLAVKGAKVFSFHPLQTFPRDFAPARILPHVRGIFYGVDGTLPAIRVARTLADELDGEIILIPPEMRILYHAACVVASNHLTTVLRVLERMFQQITGGRGDFYRVFSPIIEATLDNVRNSSPAEALSGPIARGGVRTVQQHLDALRTLMPGLLPYFTALSLETVGLAIRKGSIDTAVATTMENLLRSTHLQPQMKQENT